MKKESNRHHHLLVRSSEWLMKGNTSQFKIHIDIHSRPKNRHEEKEETSNLFVRRCDIHDSSKALIFKHRNTESNMVQG